MKIYDYSQPIKSKKIIGIAMNYIITIAFLYNIIQVFFFDFSEFNVVPDQIFRIKIILSLFFLLLLIVIHVFFMVFINIDLTIKISENGLEIPLFYLWFVSVNISWEEITIASYVKLGAWGYLEGIAIQTSIKNYVFRLLGLFVGKSNALTFFISPHILDFEELEDIFAQKEKLTPKLTGN